MENATPPELEDLGHYEGRTFGALDLRARRLASVEFVDCRIERCRLNEAELVRCSFEECSFVDCDLSLLKLAGSVLVEVTFTRCKLLGVDWTRMSASGSRLRQGFRFEECVLDLGSFVGLSLADLSLWKCSAKDADFSGADLSNADCRAADFGGARFQNTDLSGADLSEARNYRIDPLLNQVRRARFSLPEALTLLDPFCIELG